MNRAAFLGLLAALAVAGWLIWTDADQRAEITSLDSRISRLESRLAQAEDDLTRLRSTLRQAAVQTITVYYTRAGVNDELALVPVHREVPKTTAPVTLLRAGLAELLKGPTAAEKEEQQAVTQIPEGVRLRSARVEGDVATLDFSSELERVGGTLRITGILRQITYTATGVPGIRRVRLLIEGRQTGTDENPFTGDGFLFDLLSREFPPTASR